jgi:hypothetical protein
MIASRRSRLKQMMGSLIGRPSMSIGLNRPWPMKPNGRAYSIASRLMSNLLSKGAGAIPPFRFAELAPSTHTSSSHLGQCNSPCIAPYALEASIVDSAAHTLQMLLSIPSTTLFSPFSLEGAQPCDQERECVRAFMRLPSTYPTKISHSNRRTAPYRVRPARRPDSAKPSNLAW